ncbi:hypothetical protein BGZ47_007358 [Haplosporangium gracile]|nr:hypothetical protein BGZ47_007358 [Haplosporangium gracile]
MNALVNYGTDSDSDSDDDDISLTHSTKKTTGAQARTTTNNNANEEEEDDPILTALKDLQDFAASVNENGSELSPSDSTNRTAAATGSGEPMEQDQEELKFLSFLQEIDAIPNPDDEQPPPPPPPPPPSESPLDFDNVPPPPPAPSSTSIPALSSTSASTTESQANSGTTAESIHQSVQMIYNRLYHISLLPSSSSVTQDLERRLLEFAIRIVDWKKGGLEEAYFLGQDLADALALEVDGSISTQEGVVTALPDFSGIVGSMIQYMFRLEQMATPNGWMAVWDTEDEAYGFQHVRTGLYSPVYPSMDLITTLDPPVSTTSTHARKSPTTYKSNTSWNYYPSATTPSASSPSAHSFPTIAITMTAPVLNPWAAPAATTTVTLSPQSAGSDGINSLIQSPSLANTKTSSSTGEPAFGTAKKKKRKTDDSISTTASGDDGSLFDQSIHPSRRAALVKNGGGNPASTAKASSSSSSSSSKVMPKKLASLLQKWNEKDVEMSDDDEDENNDPGQQDLGNSRTGANSQSLGGGDWRDRRHHHK